MRPVKTLGVAAVFAASSLLRAATASVSPAAPVTVLIDFEKPHSAQSIVALRQELETLLQPAGVKIDLQIRNEQAASREFADLVVFKMKGSCVMEQWPEPALWDERGPLGMAYASDGEVLHFGEVQCDRIRQALDRALGHALIGNRQSLLGRALGLVIGHEVYHMMANATTHTKHGVTKESLTARELLAGDLSLSSLAREALQQAVIGGRPASQARTQTSTTARVGGFF